MNFAVLLRGFQLVLAGTALAIAAPVSIAAERQPNIVVILADDFGWGSASCYGAKGVETPNIDRLAKEGRRFTNAYAPGSVCSPTRYGLMTGRYYWRTSVKDGRVLRYNAPLHIETSRTTLATICKTRGYATGAFGKWHLGWTNATVEDWSKPLTPGPLDVGFDYYFGMAANIGSGPHSFIENRAVTGGLPGKPITIAGGSREGDTTSGIEKPWVPNRVMETVTGRVTGWIEKQKRDAPFFVYFAPNAVHEPIVPNPQFTGNALGKYGDFIRELDWSVGQVLATLDRLGMADNTLVIFTSDNGGVTNPGNESAQAAIKAGLAINGPLKGGKHSEWEGGFREPFLARWPGRVPAGTVSDQVICHTDLAATFAAFLGVPLTKGNAEDSFDVTRALTEAAPGAPVRDHVILQAADAIYDLRMGDWKLVERQGAPSFDSVRNKKKAAAAEKKKARQAEMKDELYNLREDPAEARDAAPENADRVAQMKRFLAAARDRGFTRPGAGP